MNKVPPLSRISKLIIKAIISLVVSSQKLGVLFVGWVLGELAWNRCWYGGLVIG